MPYQLRLSPLATGLIWLLVILLATAFTAQPFLWHVDFFKLAGPGFHKLILVLLPVLFLAPLVYLRIRQAIIWRYELKIYLVLALLPLLIYEPRALVVAALFFTSAFSTGYWLLKATGLEPAEAVEEIVLSTATGLSVFTLLLSALGLAGLFKIWAFALLLTPCVMGWRQLLEDIQEIFEDWTNAEELRSPLAGIAIFFGYAFVVISALTALTSTTNGDAIRFHLALAKSYLQSGNLSVPAFIDYGYFPQNYELLTAMLWGVGGLAAAQMLTPILFLLCLMLVYYIGRLCGLSRAAAFVGAVIGGSIPFVHWTGGVVKNDMLLVVLQLSGLIALLQSWRMKNFRWSLLAAALLATSFGVKHTALFGAVALAPLLAATAWREANRFKAFATLAIVFLVLGGGWACRTWIIKGSPLFPEVQKLGVPSQPSGQASGTPAHPSLISSFSSLPYNLHFRSRGYFESPSNNSLGIFLLFLLPLALGVKSLNTNSAARFTLCTLLIYFAMWGFTLSALRYAIAPLLLMTMFLAGRSEAFYSITKKANHWLLQMALIYCFVFSLLVTIIQEMVPQLPRLLTFTMQQTDFLREFLPPFGAMEYLNKVARPEDKILSIGNYAIAYAPYPAQVKHLFNNDRKYTTDDVHRELPKLNYRYLILPVGPDLQSLEESARKHRALAEVYAGPDFRLYLLN